MISTLKHTLYIRQEWGSSALLWILAAWMLFLNPLVGFAQPRKSQLFKIAPLQFTQGYFGLTMETRLRWGPTYEPVPSQLYDYQQFLDLLISPHNKYYVGHLGYYHRYFESNQERIQGPYFRFGCRHYFMRQFPERLYLQILLGYQLLYLQRYDRENDLIQRSAIHGVEVLPTMGWQFLLGRRQHWVVDPFVGLNINWLMNKRSIRPEPVKSLPRPLFQFGVAVGVAFNHPRYYN
jgi:hypothetical protein